MATITTTTEFSRQSFPTNGAIQSNIGLGTYTAVANASSYQMGYKTSGASNTWYQRSVFTRYDTSVIPSAATVTEVKARWRITGTTNGTPAPSNWQILLRMGTWIGGTLDATASDYGVSSGATHTYNYNPDPPNGIYEITLPSAFHARINKSGQTDVGWYDQSAFTFGTDHFQTFTHSSVYPRIIVTYEQTVPDPIGIPHAGL